MRPIVIAFLAAVAPATSAQQSPAPTAATSAIVPAPAISAAEARQTATDLAQKLDEGYVFPDVAKRYAAMLRANAASGAYDSIGSADRFAERLTNDLRAVSADAHLRVTLRDGQPMTHKAAAETHPKFPWKPIEEERWLAPGIAYIRFNVFPGDPDTVAEVTKFMKDHVTAKVIIFDNRTHHGGGLAEMNAMFPYLFSKSTALVDMDTRESVAEPGEEPFVRKVPGIPGVNIMSSPTRSRNGCSRQKCSF